MKHKYNIPNMLMSIIGYRGLPFPGAFKDLKTGKGNDEEPAKEDVQGTQLYAKDKLGRWYFMPVKIKHPKITLPDNLLELDYAVLSITGKKNIVETPLVGRKGSVKELISMDDYKISVAAFIQSSDGTYPREEITQIRELFALDEAVELISAFSDLIFDPGDKVVITDIGFPSTPGIEDGQAIKLEMVTDKPFELTL